MDNVTLLAIIDGVVNEAIKNIEIPEGPRGLRGLPGVDGNDFNLEDHKELIVELIKSHIPTSFELSDDLKEELRGRDGKDGRSFNLDEHREELIELIVSHLPKEIILTEEQKEELRGPKGLRGEKGADGKDFDFEEHKEEIEALVQKHSLKFKDLTEDQIESLKGADGKDGADGRDGKDFDLEENIELLTNAVNKTVQEIKEQLKLKFDDLTIEEKESLRGSRGQRGKAGRDFEFSEHEEAITNIITTTVEKVVANNFDNLKLRFTDLTEEERISLQGLQGPKGDRGKDFDFEEHKEEIVSVIKEHIENISESLKLKFEDLSDEAKEELRGPRGQRGKAGRDFSLEESKSFIEEVLRQAFNDSAEDLKLRYSHLTAAEKEELKFKFEDFTEENLLLLRGPRGQRGKQGEQGIQGEKGEKGEDGIRGPIGARGPVGPKGLKGENGLNGEDGRDGRDGKDAPVLEEVRVEKRKDSLEFVFEMSDGQKIKSNPVKLPPTNVQNVYVGGATASGSGGETPASEAEWIVKNKIAGETISAFNIVRLYDANTIVKCSNNSTYSDARAIGISLSAGDAGDTIRVLILGIIENTFFNYPAGTLLFLGTNGTITDTAPTSGHLTIIGECPANGVFSISIKEPIVL